MNILIIGLGAIGSIYAVKLKEAGFNVKVLIDEQRLEKYTKEGIIFNGKKYDFDYILPNANFSTDLIIIAVKSYSLNEIIPNLKNFITSETITLSLLNGISSEEEIQKAYPKLNVLKSYYIGHASMKKGNEIKYDGIGKIVVEKNEKLQKIFDKAKIEYENSSDIISSMWQKFIINIGVNQTTAILKQPYSCFKRKEAREIARGLISEGIEIAKRIGIKNYEKFSDKTFEFIDTIPKDCKTSMMQDIEKGKRTEVDIFAGEICRLGEIYGIGTPNNRLAYNIIKSLEK